MSALQEMAIVWGVILAAFTAVMIYRGYLSNHETQQLFLSDNIEDHLIEKHDKVSRRASRVDPVFNSLGGVAVLLTVAMASIHVVREIPYMRF